MRILTLVRACALAVGALVGFGSSAAASGPPLTRQTKLEAAPGEPGDLFGQSVSVSGTTILIGAPTQGTQAGSAHVFVRNGSTWSSEQTLMPDPGDGALFGNAVAVDMNTAVVGAYGDATNGTFAGAAYVFARTGTSWALQQKIMPTDAVTMDLFGYAVALSGDTLAIGANGDDDRGAESGSTYIFVRSGTTWSLQQKLTASDGVAGDNFGAALAMDGDTLLVGSVGVSTGAVYAFVRSGATWSLQQKLQATGGASGDAFGQSVALSGDTALVGACHDGTAGVDAGAAYEFTRTGTTWSQQHKLMGQDTTAGDGFGVAVATSSDRAIIGSLGNSARGADSGAAYIFDRSGSTWSQTQKVIASDGASNNYLGGAVALDGTIAGLGAYGRSDQGLNSGAAYAVEPPPSIAPALGRYSGWVALLFLVAGFLILRRRFVRAAFAASASLVLCVGLLAGCGAHTDSEASPVESTGQIEESLGPTTSTVTLSAQQDVSVKASSPDANFRSVLVLDHNRTLIQFSQAALAGTIGTNDYLVNAQLDMSLAQNPFRRIPRISEAFRLTHSWTESGATFDCAVDGNPQNSVADCSGASAWSMTSPPNPWAVPSSATIVIPGILAGTVHYDLTSDVRAFIHGDFPNFGWMLKGTDSNEVAQFSSRESSTPPHLVLTVRHCTAAACDDGNACTVDSCDAQANCAHTPVANGTSCSDGNACTQGDACQAGACVAGTPVVCTPPDQCHTASCDTGTGACVPSAVANGTACNDGNACTQSDTCQAGACVGANPVVCASSDGCHPGVCNPSNGTCSSSLACHLYGVGSIPSNATDGLAVSPAVLEDGTPNNQVGALGSAIAYTGVGNLYVATPDRGPNNGLDSYTDRYYLVELTLSGGTVSASLRGGATLKRDAGATFTGLSSAFDATGSPNSLRLDPEGVRVSPSGTFFVSDEYGPYLYEFGADGTRLRALSVPSKFLIASPNADGTIELTGNTSGRQSNRGMEGLAITPDGTRLFGAMQNALLQDGALSGTTRVGTNNRILEYDLATNVTHEYLYQLTNRSYGVNEIVAINDHQFLTIERDGNGGTAAAFKELYFVDVSNATDISGIANLPSTGTPAGVVPVTKQPFLNLLDSTYGLAGASFPEKIEGLAFGPDLPDGRHVLVVTNDNDFLSANPNNFYVFTIDPVALPGYQSQMATFSNACVTPSPVTCPGTDECHLAGMCRPDNATCVPRTAPAGTPTSSQTTGDCHQNQCDASGMIVSAVDNTDVPVDNNQCTNDVCTSGTPSNPPVAANTPCNQNGGNRCDGAGSCVQCLVATDCPGTDAECSFRTCTAGVCGIGFAPSGQPVAQQTTGDCHQNQCDGAGGVVSAIDNSDVPNDGNSCTNDVCTSGVPSNPPAPPNTACSAGVCDGNGACVGCTLASQCPGSDTFCATRTCTAGTCGFSYTAAGTALPSQTAGDCKVQACDGAGNTVANNDDSDVPVDGNACTSDVCTAGVPSNPSAPYGTVCGTNLICNNGACVDLTFRVVRIGDGSAALTGNATPVFVEERKVADGTLLGTLSMPTSANGSNARFTDSGTATSDGALSLSVDGRFLSLAGYDAAVGTAGVAGLASSTTNRVIGRINAAGNIDTSTRFNTAFNANNIRSAVSLDGSGFWASGAGGATGGAWFISLGTTGGNQLNAVNTRVLGIFQNQLYASSASSPNVGMNTVGSPPPPTSGAQPAMLLPLASGQTQPLSAYGFVLLTVNGVNTLYVADDSTIANGGGIQKWTQSSGVWTRVTTFTTSTTPIGFRGVTGRLVGSTVQLVGSSADASADRLVVFVDDGTTITNTTIASSATNMIFRGVAFSPHN